ncbi:MAG: hypothetical protein ACM3MI_12610 [Clostridiales bacterium]
MELLINKNLTTSSPGAISFPVLNESKVLDLLPVQSIGSRIDKAITLLTEDYFSFGKLLQENYLLSKKAVKNLIGITDLVSNEVLKSELEHLFSTIEDLARILRKFEKESSQKENNLLGIQNKLLSIISTLEDYKKIVKHLRVLGISTKIENARLKIDGIGFSTIAENVERLSEVINDKALQINHRSKILLGDVENIISNIRRLGDEQNKESRLIIEKAKSSLSSYQQSYNSAFNSAIFIHELSSKLSADINNLITSIQIQDIIRQQLEHVKENLADVSMASSKNELLLDDDVTQIKKLLAVCQLELAQVLHSKSEIEETAQSIDVHNRNISLNADKIVEQSGSFITSGDAWLCIKALEENLSVISGVLKKGHNTNESLTTAINTLAATIADSNKFVFEIEEIGAEIELIALNARIKAAHIGEEGAALGVLSEAIQKLSLEAKELSIQISDGLRKVLNATEELSKSNKDDQETILQEFGTIDESLKTSLFSIQQSNLDLNNLKTELNIHFQEMQQKLDLLKNGLISNNEVLREITCIEEILQEYLEFASAAGIVISEEDKEFLKGLSSSYTMFTERKIHQELMDENAEGDSDSPEAEEDIFGDNIELF